MMPQSAIPETKRRASWMRLGLLGFTIGVVIVGGAYVWHYYASHSAVMNLAMAVEKNDWPYLTVEALQAKVIELDSPAQVRNQPKSSDGKTSTVQWRCKVRNDGPYPLRLVLTVEFLDKDGFLLAKTIYDSNGTSGDLGHLASQEIFQDIVVDSSRAKKFAKGKVSATALKTNEQLTAEQSERQKQENERLAAAEQKRQAALAEEASRMNAARQEAERAQRLENERLAEETSRRNAAQLAAQQQRQIEYQRELARKQMAINIEVAKWRKLRLGMKQDEVEALVGKPSSLQTFGGRETWSYPSIPGDYKSLSISFVYDMKPSGYIVDGWQGPDIAQP